MYSLIALLAGAAAKLYDDIEDNNFLRSRRSKRRKRNRNRNRNRR